MASGSKNCCYWNITADCATASSFSDGQMPPIKLLSLVIPFLTLFQTASRVVESRSQALAGQRSLADNGFPLRVSCGQGNKSSEDLGWTNYRSVGVTRWQSDNKTEGEWRDRAKARIKSAMWAYWKPLSHTDPPTHNLHMCKFCFYAYFTRLKNLKKNC